MFFNPNSMLNTIKEFDEQDKIIKNGFNYYAKYQDN